VSNEGEPLTGQLGTISPLDPFLGFDFTVKSLDSAEVWLDYDYDKSVVAGYSDGGSDGFVFDLPKNGEDENIVFSEMLGEEEPGVTNSPTPTVPADEDSCNSDSDCGWCDGNCQKISLGCAMTPDAPSGWECVCGSNSSCVGRMIAASTNTPMPTGQEDCTDSDGGKSYDVDGTTCVGDDCIMDYCDQNDGNIGVVEYFCDSDGQRANEYHLCDTEEGEICLANACRQCLVDGTPCGTGDLKTTSCNLCCDGAHQEEDTMRMICGGGGGPMGPGGTTASPTLPANAKVVSFEVALAGVREQNKCRGSNTVDVIMLKGTNRKEYRNVTLVDTGRKTETGLAIFKVDKLNVTDFGETGDVAIFVKGQKHLQMKYGVDGQDAVYNRAGGELDFDNSTVFDFTGYPILAGDVNRDGKVDGIDFTEVKNRAGRFEEVESGQSNVHDLDSSCVVNNVDIGLLTQALKEKYDQMY